MTTWVEPPPPQKGMGCFAKGCLILLVFGALLVAACIAGIYWGARHYSAITRGFAWAQKINAVSNEPAPVPEYTATEAEIEAAQTRWQRFQNGVRAGQPAEIALTAHELNALIAGDRDLAGKMFVSIEGNRLHFQMSFPTHQLVGRSAYYLNLDVAMQTDGPESIDHPQLNRIIVNGQPLPGDLLDWTMRSRRLRDYVSEHIEPNQTGEIEIRDGTLIMRVRPE